MRIDVILALLWWALATTLLLEKSQVAPDTPAAVGQPSASPGEGGSPPEQLASYKAQVLAVPSIRVHDAGGSPDRSRALKKALVKLLQTQAGTKDTHRLLGDKFHSLQQEHDDLLAEHARSKKAMQDLGTQNALLSFLLLRAKDEASVLHRAALAEEMARRDEEQQRFTLLQEYSVLSDDFSDAGNIINRLLKVLSRFQEENNGLANDLSYARKEVDRLKKVVSLSREENNGLVKALITSREENNDLIRARAISKEEINYLEKELDASKEDNEGLVKALDASKEKNDGLEKALDASKEKNEGLEKALDASKEKNEGLEKALDVFKEKNYGLVKALAVSKEENNGLVKALAVSLEENNAHAKELPIANVDNEGRAQESAAVVPEEGGPADDEHDLPTSLVPVDEAEDTDDLDDSAGRIPEDEIYYTDENTLQ